MAIALALLQLVMLDHIALAALILPLAFFIIYWEWTDFSAGSVIIWRHGQWFVARGTQEIPATLESGAVNLPQLLFFSLHAAQVHTRWRIFLFSDSADEAQLRQLRCRLTLSRYAQESD